MLDNMLESMAVASIAEPVLLLGHDCNPMSGTSDETRIHQAAINCEFRLQDTAMVPRQGAGDACPEKR